MSSESLYQQGPKYFPCNILSTTQNSELYDSEAENALFLQLFKFFLVVVAALSFYFWRYTKEK